MKYKIKNNIVRFIAICSIASIFNLSAMDDITLETSDGQEITLLKSLITEDSLKLIEKNKEKLNSKLPAKAWRLAFDIFLMAKVLQQQPGIDINFHLKEKNPFFKHKIEIESAKKFIKHLSNFTGENQILVGEILNAFVLFVRSDDIRSRNADTEYNLHAKVRNSVLRVSFLNKLPGELAHQLDKYQYLNFDEHLPLPDNLLAYVSTEDLIKFKKLVNNDKFPTEDSSRGLASLLLLSPTIFTLGTMAWIALK